MSSNSAFMSFFSLVSSTQSDLLLISGHFMLCPVASWWAHHVFRKPPNDLELVVSFANQWLLCSSSGCLFLGAFGYMWGSCVPITGFLLQGRTAVLVSFLLLLQNVMTKNNIEKDGFILAHDSSYSPRTWGSQGTNLKLLVTP